MIHHVLHYLTFHLMPAVHFLGAWFYLLVLVIALLESTLIIGTFVPGTAILLFFGFIAASQHSIDLFWIVLATSVGAVIGDYVSYLVGKYGRGFVKENKGLLRMSHVEVGKAFFLKHGGKSVLLGRFVSPLRQIIPFIAGMVGMSYKRFTYLNVIGAFLWATAYILLGYYFGANSRLIDKVISRVGIVLTLIIIAGAAYIFHKHRQKRFEALQKGDGPGDS